MMHAGKCCVHYVDANKYTLAHMLQRVGEKIGYTYDFGDKFLHNIQVEEIKPAAESDGSVVVLEGRGMCPPEDNGRGNRSVVLPPRPEYALIRPLLSLVTGPKTFTI